MAEPSFHRLKLPGIPVGSVEFWRENIGGGWATFLVILFIVIWHSFKAFQTRFRSKHANPTTLSPNQNTLIGISKHVSDADLRNLINSLEEKLNKKERWEHVIDKRNNLVSYNAKCCKPKDGPLKYLSVTTFEKCTTVMLRDFYMDNEYRKVWDKIVVEYEQLQVDEISGTEIGRTVKKFPLLTPREYVLAWRTWEGKEKTFYCFIKECDHALAPQRKKYVRVGLFRSGWRIRKVPGRDACEIKMVHQEDAGLNVEMAKLLFAKGIWSYVCKMDTALRKYHPLSHIPVGSSVTALGLIQKVPRDLEMETPSLHQNIPGSSATSATDGRPVWEIRERPLSKKPLKKWIANGLLLLGGVVCLSRGHSSLGAKLAMACILKKLAKHGSSSSRAEPSHTSHM
eukprot:TRINITY_DN882_c0_g1_i1.p1 TRINITY_DN882_c0_g1~~TRINITY_DN882_c0_g1_i1.p1  ORF type:complete len:409 (-),score=51.42 TRINITY_DN882_c0_g1_i1:223-1416(-)